MIYQSVTIQGAVRGLAENHHRCLEWAADTAYVHTYYEYVNVTFSIDGDVLSRACRRAEALGTSVNQLVREYLEQLAGNTDSNEDAAEFERLARLAQGDPRGWKFNRDELHERR